MEIARPIKIESLITDRENIKKGVENFTITTFAKPKITKP